MGRRTIFLILGLLIALIVTATVVDVVAPNSQFTNLGLGFGPFRRPFDRAGPPGRPTALWEQFGLPRTARSLAGVAALMGYALMLWYLVPQRIATLVEVIFRSPTRIIRYGVVGLALLVLLMILILLATISLIALPLVPLFSVASSILLLTGVVLSAVAFGRWLRAKVADEDVHPLADLLVGLLALMLVAVIPVVGTFVIIVCGAVGMGAMVMTHFGLRDDWQLE